MASYFFTAQIELGLVGLDLVLLVMGQELVSFKIVDAALTTEIASETACEGPCGSSAVIVALTVEDMSLRDMQVPQSFLQDALLLQAAISRSGRQKARVLLTCEILGLFFMSCVGGPSLNALPLHRRCIFARVAPSYPLVP